MFYTSPYLRTRQTCENIISRIKGIPNVDFNVREEPRMREQDFGNFQQSAQEMEKIWEERADYGHFFYRIPHGESAADVYDRVASFNESLYRQFKNDDFPNILVLVSHGIWSRVFLMKWFKWTYEEFETLKNIPHCQFLIMKRNRESLRYELKTKLQTWSVWCVKEGGKKKKNVDDESDGESDDESDAKKGNSQRFILCQLPEDNEVVQMIEAQKPAAESTREKDKKIAEMYRNIHSSEAKRLYENQLVTTLKMGNQSENNSSIESLNEPR
ncbi:hypothetical protein KGF56_004344 [Candida oxycetoniae]|uniref:Uncharacterized protein n=1 Tax=Candida oxycetoniae TaxID=497107 RepID=A0AAI9SU65_9ASCO|nr:uncharacterized protein KGF56_004344 [Candida oxycetoniae]KAI3402883.2 hypothetical protein KGF56_004344 [Candida oxycetoniae]